MSNPLSSIARGAPGEAEEIQDPNASTSPGNSLGAPAPDSESEGDQSSSAPPPSGGPGSALIGMQQNLLAAKAQYQKALSAEKMLDTMKGGMDRLLQLGDMVSTEDLMKEAAELVGVDGVDPNQLATMLAQAPTWGQALAGWLQQQDLSIQQNELQIRPVVELLRHSVGVAAMHVLMVQHIQQHGVNGPQGGPPTASASPPAESVSPPTSETPQ